MQHDELKQLELELYKVLQCIRAKFLSTNGVVITEVICEFFIFDSTPKTTY